MKYNKGFAPIIIALIIAGALVLGGGAYYFNKSSDNNKKEIKIEENKITSCVSSTGKIMTYGKALEIAKASSCAQVGNFTGEYGCNDNAGGMINVAMDPINHPGCGFACRVSIDKEVAEEGWMCTGALPATKEQLDKIPTIK
jgi:hypothetical protein